MSGTKNTLAEVVSADIRWLVMLPKVFYISERQLKCANLLNDTHRFALLKIPFPEITGIIEVEAVLNDITSASEVNGSDGGGRLL